MDNRNIVRQTFWVYNVFMLEKSIFGFWSVTIGPLKDPNMRTEMRKWTKRNMKHKHTVDITCEPGRVEEFWTFDDERDATIFFLKYGHL